MNKYLQILLAITSTIWAIIGIGVIAGSIILWNLPTILGINVSLLDMPVLFSQPTIQTRVQLNCVEEKAGTDSARMILSEAANEISKDVLNKIEPCFN